MNISSSAIIRYLNELGINDTVSAKNVLSVAPRERLFEISNDLAELTKRYKSNTGIGDKNIFNFTASGSISGSGQSCSGISCRISEARELGQFAALYGDRITIPNFLETHGNIGKSESMKVDLDHFINVLHGDIAVLMVYGDLLETGLIKFSANQVMHCTRCMQRMVVGNEQKTIIKRYDELNKMTLSMVRKNVVFEHSLNNRIDIYDPNGYTDSDGHSLTLIDQPLMKNLPLGIIKESDVIDLKLAEYVSNGIVDDVLQQNVGQMQSRSTYLTPRLVDAFLIDTLNNKSLSFENNSDLMKNITHNLPLANGNDFIALVNVRSSQIEYFERYKHSLSLVLKQLGTNPKSEDVKEALDQEVLPHLLKLDQILKAHSETSMSDLKAMGKITAVTVTLGIAATTTYHLDPSAVIGLGAIASPSALSGIKHILRRKEQPTEVKENQYYFLWNQKH
ncbi:MAG: hypothetical protein ABIQ04_01120 [Candidatus Saccharimonadales bacterium]